MSDTERKYPALGRGVWGVLVRNEWFKATRRLAFLVTFGLFAFIHLMDYGEDAVRAQRDPEFTHALLEPLRVDPHAPAPITLRLPRTSLRTFDASSDEHVATTTAMVAK